jgi:hypothetical protein
MSIDQLCQICPPAVRALFAGGADKWRQMEESLGLCFPEDYKPCLDRYGHGEFDGFLYVLDPFFEAPGYDYFNHIREILAAYTTLKSVAPDRLPFACYPAKDGLFPAATTSNGDVIYWATHGEPENWPLIVYASRHWRYERFNFGIVELVTRMLLGSLNSDILPEDLPPGFSP